MSGRRTVIRARSQFNADCFGSAVTSAHCLPTYDQPMVALPRTPPQITPCQAGTIHAGTTTSASVAHPATVEYPLPAPRTPHRPAPSGSQSTSRTCHGPSLQGIERRDLSIPGRGVRCRSPGPTSGCVRRQGISEGWQTRKPAARSTRLRDRGSVGLDSARAWIQMSGRPSTPARGGNR